jgi:hypothetical protein
MMDGVGWLESKIHSRIPRYKKKQTSEIPTAACRKGKSRSGFAIFKKCIRKKSHG